MMKKLTLTLFLCAAIALTGCDKKKDIPVGSMKITDLPIMTSEKYNEVKAENKGKVMIVNFFASWCPPCRTETPYFVSIFNEFMDKNFVIIGITIDDDKNDALKFVNEFDITYPVYLADPALQRKFNVSKVPTNFIYNAESNLADIREGMISEGMLRRIAELASGEE